MSLPFRKTSLVIPFALSGLLATTSLHAADFLWDGSESNDWANPLNWAGGAVPSGTDIRINVGASGATNITWANRLVYSADQGTTNVGGNGIRGLFIANGSGTVGNVEITGGVLNSLSTSTDGIANGGGNGSLVINGGTYSKLNGDNTSGTFSLNYGAGTSLLDINSGAFQVNRLDFQENLGDATTTGTIQLDGGTLSVGRFLKTNTTAGTHNVNLNGGTVESRITATWADLAGVTWTLQSKSTFSIGNTVTFAEALGGAGGFEKTGTGNFTVSGANTYTGVTTATAGILSLSNNSALGATGAGNGTIVNSGGRVSLNNGVTITGESISITGDGGSNGALQAAAGATGTWNGTVTTTGSSARVGSQTGGNLIINGDIDATATNLTIRSNGSNASTAADFDSTVVTLGGTYTGTQLVLFQGVVKLGASDRINDATIVNFGTSTSTAIKQRFDLNGFNETVAAVIVSGSAASDTHEITNSSSTKSTLTVNSPNATAREFSGVITGNLDFQKLGSNTVTFSGVNTYTGNTSVSAGTLNVSTAGQMNGGGSTTVASGATFSMLGTYLFNIGNAGVNNDISGAGALNLGGTINLNLAAAAIAEGNSWTLVNTSGFSAINWSGTQVTSSAGAFTKNGNLWTLDEGGRSWEFNETSGVLSLVSIPEPGQITLLIAGLGAVAWRRRRAA